MNFNSFTLKNYIYKSNNNIFFYENLPKYGDQNSQLKTIKMIGLKVTPSVPIGS